jgi:hypothetical protein
MISHYRDPGNADNFPVMLKHKRAHAGRHMAKPFYQVISGGNPVRHVRGLVVMSITAASTVHGRGAEAERQSLASTFHSPGNVKGGCS